MDAENFNRDNYTELDTQEFQTLKDYDIMLLDVKRLFIIDGVNIECLKWGIQFKEEYNNSYIARLKDKFRNDPATIPKFQCVILDGSLVLVNQHHSRRAVGSLQGPKGPYRTKIGVQIEILDIDDFISRAHRQNGSFPSSIQKFRGLVQEIGAEFQNPFFEGSGIQLIDQFSSFNLVEA